MASDTLRKTELSAVKIFLFGYVVISVFAGISAIKDAGWIVAGGLVLASMLGWIAGSGLRGSLIAGNKSQKIAGVVLTSIFLLIAHLIADYTQFNVGLFDIKIVGGVWWLIGFFLGFIATTKKDAVGKNEIN